MSETFNLLNMDVKSLKNSSSFKAELHGFHMVEPSPWPFITAFSVAQLIMLCLFYFHYFKMTSLWAFWVFFYFSSVIGMWFSDVVIESTFQGMHTLIVQSMHKAAFMLVIFSEVMFFFGFFRCFFYFAISPSIWMGCVWPPFGMTPMHPFGMPLLNTVVLMSSGVTASFAHSAILSTDTSIIVFKALMGSVAYGVAFTLLQLWEYINAPFSMSDGMYGSMFFVSTGFHGLHVIVGTIALIVCVLSHWRYHFQIDHHMGLELSMWYWHFVDIMWILLYLFVYLWGYSW